VLRRVFERTAACDGERSRDEAFAELHRDHAAGVYNLALRMVGEREDARDISQDVLLKAYARLSEPRELDQSAWLYRVTVNACYDHLRARKRRPQVPLEPGFEPAATIDLYEQSEMRRHLQAALVRVSPVQRAALLLREMYGLRTDEIATALGMRSTSAEVTLSRARKSFRRHFVEVSGASAEAAAPHGADVARPAGASSRAGGVAVGLGLGVLALPSLPLPAGLEASSILAAVGRGAGAGLGGGALAGTLAKIAAALSTKAAVVAIGATVVAGGIGGVYSMEQSAGTGWHGSPAVRSASGAPAERRAHVASGAIRSHSAVRRIRVAPAAVAPAPAAVAAHPSATPTASASPTPLVVGESSSSPTPSATPSQSPTPTPSDSPSASPSPSPTPTPGASPSGSPSATPSATSSPASSPAP
jgi:RNA polymerase sigma-70 factor, ECF subfamily